MQHVNIVYSDGCLAGLGGFFPRRYLPYAYKEIANLGSITQQAATNVQTLQSEVCPKSTESVCLGRSRVVPMLLRGRASHTLVFRVSRQVR